MWPPPPCHPCNVPPRRGWRPVAWAPLVVPRRASAPGPPPTTSSPTVRPRIPSTSGCAHERLARSHHELDPCLAPNPSVARPLHTIAGGDSRAASHRGIDRKRGARSYAPPPRGWALQASFMMTRRKLWNSAALFIGLVKKSAMLFFVRTKGTVTSYYSTMSRTKKCRRSQRDRRGSVNW